MSVPLSTNVPLLFSAFVPASSSIRPLTVTSPPPSMFSVRPDITLPTPVPEIVRSTPLPTTTNPPPVHTLPLPLHVFPVPVSVSVPDPVNVPPLCV